MALKEMFFGAVREVFAHVASAGMSAFAPYREDSVRVIRLPNGSKQSRREIVARLDARQFIHDHWAEMAGGSAVSGFLTSLVDAVRVPQQRPENALTFSGGTDDVRPRVEELMSNVIANIAYPAETSSPDEPTVERFWNGLDAFLFKDTIPVTESGLLIHFGSEVERVQLADGFGFHRMSDEEMSDWATSGHRMQGDMVFFDLDWMVSWDYDATPLEHGHGRREPSLIDALVLALRLLKPGAVCLKRWRHKSKYPFPGHGGVRGRAENPEAYGPQYLLTAQDIGELQHLFDAVLRERFVGFAPAKRFEQSYGEREVGERMADLVIALEGLFAPEKDESIAYRLSARAAKMLEPDPARRHALFRKLKTLYSLRSILLHGGELEPGGRAMKAIKKYAPSPHEFAAQAEALVRQALKERLFHPESFTQEALDRMILT